MASVTVYNGNIEKALRKLKKQLMKDGTLQEYRDRQHFEKKSERRTKAKAAAVQRHRRAVRDAPKY